MMAKDRVEMHPKMGEMLSRHAWMILLSAAGLATAVMVALLPWELLGAPLVGLVIAGGAATAFILAESYSEDRLFAARLFFVALGVHLAALCIFWWLGGARQSFWLNDSQAYDRVGWAWAQAWSSGASSPSGLGAIAYIALDTYPKIVGGVYLLLGHSPATILVLQAVLGASSVYLGYRMSATLLGSVTARLAGWLMLGYTGFLLFSIMILKDAPGLFLILFAFDAWFHLLKELDRPLPWGGKIIPMAFWSLLAVASVIVINQIRDYTTPILIGAWLLSLAHVLVRHSGKWKWATFVGLILAGVLVIWLALPRILAIVIPPILNAPDSMIATFPQPTNANSVGELLQWIRLHPSGFTQYMLAASASTLIAPFAWIFPNLLSGLHNWNIYIIGFPGMWLWYLLIPFAAIGAISALRRTRGDVLPILFFAVVMFLVVSLLIPRETRHRDMMMPFALILASQGLVYGRRWAALGFLVWLPLAGFMAWKLGMLLPAVIMIASIGIILLVIFARQQRLTRAKSLKSSL